MCHHSHFASSSPRIRISGSAIMVLALSVMVPPLADAAPAGPSTPVIYVDDDAPPGGNGATWATAYRFLHDALSDKPGITEFRVAQGLYKPDRSESAPKGTGNRAATFSLPGDCSLIGGFAGLGAPDPDQRDPKRFETILSGDLHGDDGPAFANYEDNSLHVLSVLDPALASYVNGFAITAGNADGEDEAGRGGGATVRNIGVISHCRFTLNRATNGGGAYLHAPMLIDCRFESNHAVERGGAIASFDYTIVRAFNCTFTSNGATQGGAVFIDKSKTYEFVDCLFAANSASEGGAIYNVFSATYLFECDFVGNDADIGGAFCNVRTEELQATGGDPRLESCWFYDNTALLGGAYADLNAVHHVTILGGGIFDCTFENCFAVNGGAVYAQDSHGLYFAGCSFRDNDAAIGGGMFLSGINLKLLDCNFDANAAIFTGGAIEFFDGDTEILQSHFTMNDADRGGAIAARGEMVISGCLFEQNSADCGGAVELHAVGSVLNSSFLENVAGDEGGGLHAEAPAQVVIDRATFAFNQAYRGGGIYAVNADSFQLTNALIYQNEAERGAGINFRQQAGHSAVVVNCTLIDNHAGFSGSGFEWTAGNGTIANCIIRGQDALEFFSSDVIIRYSNIEGGSSGEGNIDVGPEFVNPDTGDFRLSANSPCIDAGDNFSVPSLLDLDRAGDPRFIDDPATIDTGLGDPPIVDIGAYEFQPRPCPADLDGDAAVTFLDFSLLLSQWGQCSNCPADLDGDGAVGFNDFVALLAAWGPCP